MSLSLVTICTSSDFIGSHVSILPLLHVPSHEPKLGHALSLYIKLKEYSRNYQHPIILHLLMKQNDSNSTRSNLLSIQQSYNHSSSSSSSASSFVVQVKQSQIKPREFPGTGQPPAYANNTRSLRFQISLYRRVVSGCSGESCRRKGQYPATSWINPSDPLSGESRK